jgi:hypothetical protein
MFTGLSVSCKKIRAEKAAPEGQQGAAIEFTVPPGQNFILFKPKEINIVQTQNFGRGFARLLHCKKRLSIFPSPAGMSLTKLSLARKNLINPA